MVINPIRWLITLSTMVNYPLPAVEAHPSILIILSEIPAVADDRTIAIDCIPLLLADYL